jgi:hypothetical protein
MPAESGRQLSRLFRSSQPHRRKTLLVRPLDPKSSDDRRSGTICAVISSASSRKAQPELTRKLVYGHAQFHDCLAFADAGTAAEETHEIVAIASARTWGEARSVAVRHTWNPAAAEYDGNLDEHGDDARFDILDLGSVFDGDWPGMVTSRAVTVLPKDLQARYGKNVATVFNGDYLEIPLAAEGELIAALRERGFEVTRDDNLINTLDGRTFNPLG